MRAIGRTKEGGMTIRSFTVSAVTSLIACSGVALAHHEGPPQPGPEHQKLARFVGKWSGSGDVKPGPMGPGGKMTWTETCDWFAGGFHIICNSTGSGPGGEIKGMGILGYDAASKMYTYYGVDNNGMGDYAKGTLQGKTWTYNSDATIDGKAIKSRFIIDEVSDKSQKFKWEMSEDGKTWMTVMDGQSNK